MGLRVLLLDSDCDALELCAGLLEGKGYNVFSCSSCEHAERMVELVRPRVIVLQGCEAGKEVVFQNLLQRAPYVPIAYFSAEEECYEVFTAAGRQQGYSRCGELHSSVDGAIRAAVVSAMYA